MDSLDNIARAILPVATIIAVLSLFIPSFWSTARQAGKKGVFIGTLLLILGFVVEYINAQTGFVYGYSHYSSILGNKVLGLVPWTIPLLYAPILTGLFWLSSQLTGSRSLKTILIGLGSVLVNGLTHTAAIKTRLVEFEASGLYLGISLHSLLGWLVVGLIGGLLISMIWGDSETKYGLALPLAGVLWFTTGLNAGLELWVPAGISLLIALFASVLIWREKRQFRRKD